MKLLKMLTLAICCNISLCMAQDSFVTKTTFDTAIKKVNNKIEEAGKLTKQLGDSINAAASKKNEGDSSLFTSWQAVKKNPCPVYNNSCNGCTGNTPACGKYSRIIISILTWLAVAFLLLVSFRHFFYSALCRDESYINDNGTLKLRPVTERPYSYARAQLFWWSVIIFTCYGIFFALYGHLLPLNPTCILLLGGGLATQLLGKTIDKNQIDNTATQNQDSSVPRAIRHQDYNSSKGFLTDILSDENGISIHRLQSVAFNIIYGIGFIGYFVQSTGCCQYPFIDFESWQLTLLGISTAGYLGMKTTENSKATEQARINASVKNAAGNS